MYKKTARSQHRKVLKSNEYAPTLAVLGEKHEQSQWTPKTPSKAKLSKKKARKKRGNTLFGMKFR